MDQREEEALSLSESTFRDMFRQSIMVSTESPLWPNIKEKIKSTKSIIDVFKYSAENLWPAELQDDYKMTVAAWDTALAAYCAYKQLQSLLG